jgi:hypothetical protein
MKNVIFSLIISLLFGLTCFGQEPGLLTGTLLDQLTGDPLFGVKVTAGGQVTRTDENGVFDLNLLPVTTDVRFNRYGMYTLDMQEVDIVSGDTVIIDTALMPFPVPVAAVFAENNGYAIDVSWYRSGSAIEEKSYDLYGCDDFFMFADAGSQTAVRFDTYDHDHIIGGRIFTGDSTFPGPFLGTDFLVRVYDDEGMSGLPGNTLDEDTVVVDQYGWMGFDSLDGFNLNNTYYLSMYQLHDAPDCAPVGCSQYPANSRSILKFNEYNWDQFPLGNAMIRSWVAITHDSLYPIGCEVARYSNFDPNGDPMNGTLTVLSHDCNWYTDWAFPGLPYGCYAYAVRLLYNNGQYSPFKVSNIIYSLPLHDIAVSVTLSDSSAVGFQNIKLMGLTPPFNIYSGTTQYPGIAHFNEVMSGTYSLNIYNPGYEKYFEDSLIIQTDTSFDITLQESRFPLENLQRSPFTGLLEWEAPHITQFSWQCDTPDSCYSLTTPVLDLTRAEQWFMTIHYKFYMDYSKALVEYSTDNGRSWATLYQFTHQPDWDTVEIDLSPLSGQMGESEIIFRIHDFNSYLHYLKLDMVRIWTPNLKAHPEQYIISLNGESAGSSDSAFYQLTSLENGKSYRAGVNAIYSTGHADTVFTNFIYSQLFLPENLTGIEDDDTLRFTWSPPTGSWDAKAPKHRYPDALTGYILRYESGNIFKQYEINGPLDTSFRMHRLTCDSVSVSVTAVYDISEYGFPGESIESQPAGPVIFNAFNPISDEFSEDWSSMSFYRNCWTSEGYGMAILADQGNPGPALIFQNINVPYQAFLISHPVFIQQSADGNLVLEFDLNLISNAQSGNETLEFQVLSEGSTDWVMVKGISNLWGNIDWMHVSVDLTGFVETPLFRICLKFGGAGEETAYWTIDNIQVHHLCPGPESINAEKINESDVRVSWNGAGQKVDAKEFTQYNIYRDYNGSGYLLLDETVDTSYLDNINNSGKYCYRVSAAYNDQGIMCESLMSDDTCITSYQGIQSNSPKSRVVCYPNPAGEFIMIKSDEEISSISLCNSLGLEVKTIENPALTCKLDLNDLPFGLYLVRVNLFKEVYQMKIIHFN